MLVIGLTTIRQERVQSGGKERPGSLLYHVSERNGICGNGGKGSDFFYMGHLQIAEWSWTEGMRKERPHS